MEKKLKGCKNGSTKILREFCKDPGRDHGRWKVGDDREVGERQTRLRDMW